MAIFSFPGVPVARVGEGERGKGDEARERGREGDGGIEGREWQGEGQRGERGENVGFGNVTYQLAHLLHTCTGESIDTVFYLHLALDPTPIPHPPTDTKTNKHHFWPFQSVTC